MLLFVNTVAAGFKLRLFLESFGIRAALLNAELPLNSRSHILHCFNKASAACGTLRHLVSPPLHRAIKIARVGRPVCQNWPTANTLVTCCHRGTVRVDGAGHATCWKSS